MNEIMYDFSTFHSIFAKIKDRSSSVEPEDLRTLKDELNHFFSDSSCKEVLYTTNTDNMYFGIKIIPMIDADDIYDYLANDEEKYRLNKYLVELDSQLFDPITDISERGLTALLLREIKHIVGDSSPIENARNAVNAYLAANKDHIRVSQSIHYKEILAYGLKDYLSKADSIFYIPDIADIYNDEFIAAYGMESDLVEAYNKINNGNIKLYENSESSKFIIFSWTLSIYRHIKIHRVGAIKTLNDMYSVTGSRLEKLEINNVIRRIRRIDDDIAIRESSSDEDSIRIKLIKKNRLKNLRMIDSKFYELSMQVKNVEDEEDALYLMRQINNSISIIDEYRNMSNIDKYEIDKWNIAYDKFTLLRDKLSSSVIYKRKSYGMFVNYPDIVENRY